MTSVTFAENLRAEMGRQNLEFYDLCRKVSASILRSAAILTKVDKALLDEEGGRLVRLVTGGISPPLPAEITALATALGCPVERLTVSREELEEGLREAREDAMREAREAEKWRLWHDKVQSELSDANERYRRVVEG
jgi:hypothetical protein